MISSPQSGRPRTRTCVALLAGLCLTVTACGGGDESAGSEGDDAKKRNGGSATAVSPLTGLPAKANAPDKPVMVVKVDNTPSARPQVGIDGADLVVEELVEGGMTRLAGFYYSKHPKLVGPVRSMRDSDVGIVSPVGGKLVASGGAPGTEKRIDEAGIDVLTEGSAGFARDGSRNVPYNLMVDLADAASELKSADAPDPYLPFDVRKLKRGKKVDSFGVTFSGGSTTLWEPTKGGWSRANAPVSPRDDFVAQNVLVLDVEVGDAGYLDPGGNPVPETDFVGDGDAMLFSNGRVVRGTWSKKNLDSGIELETKGGKSLSVPAGHTFVELIPKKSGSVSLR
ncbi:MAG TPA: DUF3048 domain-containing protein [Nocardioidaceae bacterium]|nr:DUF3048 domain-containing protein [Nocardioidaceae bacterium]